jgi:hypothetical protein
MKTPPTTLERIFTWSCGSFLVAGAAALILMFTSNLDAGLPVTIFWTLVTICGVSFVVSGTLPVFLKAVKEETADVKAADRAGMEMEKLSLEIEKLRLDIRTLRAARKKHKSARRPLRPPS